MSVLAMEDWLTDSSESRRLICVEVIELIETPPIDYEQLYAQAMCELERGERWPNTSCLCAIVATGHFIT
ncbi:MAG: hypothetical protein E7099_02815 [Mediterranea massiliensis]|nr:hypothetical protein [Mediterranea massiliensis]